MHKIGWPGIAEKATLTVNKIWFVGGKLLRVRKSPAPIIMVDSIGTRRPSTSLGMALIGTWDASALGIGRCWCSFGPCALGAAAAR